MALGTALERKAARDAAQIKSSGVHVARMQHVKASENEKPSTATLAEDYAELLKAHNALVDRVNQLIDATKAANVIA